MHRNRGFSSVLIRNSLAMARRVLQQNTKRVGWEHFTALPIFFTCPVRQATSSATKSQREESITNFPERRLKLYTCGKLYEKWNRERRFWSVPKGDIPFDIRFIDTAPNETSKDRPIVVALHGGMGSVHIFDHLASHLSGKGVRVIIPEFPGISAHKVKDYRHTIEERSVLVRDLLQKLEIPRVDMLVCHSVSSFAGMNMCLENGPPEIKSLALLNHIGFGHLKVMKPYWLLRFSLRLYEFPVGKFITRSVVRMYIWCNKELKTDSVSNYIAGYLPAIHLDLLKRKTDFHQLLKADLPILLAFGENDRLVTKEQSYEVASMMVNTNEISRYDQSERLESREPENPWRKVIAFETGTHFLTRRYPRIVSEELTKFLFDNVLYKEKSQ